MDDINFVFSLSMVPIAPPLVEKFSKPVSAFKLKAANGKVVNQVQSCLANSWRRFRNLDTEVTVQIGDHRLQVSQLPQRDDSPLKTASVVWDSAFVAISFLEKYVARCIPAQVQSIVELGSGTGIVGMAASLLFPDAKVVLSDLPNTVDFLRKNVELNRKFNQRSDSVSQKPSQLMKNAQVEVIVWGQQNLPVDDAKVDLLILCDCVYQLPNSVDIHQSLVKTMDDLSDANTLILMFYEPRSNRDEATFWNHARKLFSFTEAPQEHFGSFRAPDLQAFYAQKLA